jgi:hypothetical protein
MSRALAGFFAALLLSGCSALTKLDATDKQVELTIQRQALGKMPVRTDMKTTTFGNYEFKTVRADGKAMYGILPLKFNGGYLAANILLFAPASFFNLREVYALYEFDLEKGIVRFRSAESEPWLEYTPTAAEVARARKFFGES